MGQLELEIKRKGFHLRIQYALTALLATFMGWHGWMSKQYDTDMEHKQQEMIQKINDQHQQLVDMKERLDSCEGVEQLLLQQLRRPSNQSATPPSSLWPKAGKQDAHAVLPDLLEGKP